MTKRVFVARERELTQLRTFLDQALTGHGQVCFVTGEAGAGKTALVTEFARRAQDAHADLLVAIGNCNAQTGAGDPYLPFREVLGLLTGDVEAKLAQGAITPENAGRLRDFLRVSGQALVEYGPDLIDIFVPGWALATRVAGKLAQRTGWMDRLEQLTERKAAGPGEADPSTVSGQRLEQSLIFEQYTDVLTALAGQRPLMLAVDDLQWADVSSISLLFHLGRRIGESPLLMIGSYRPDDVALGRAGERHPLEPVLNELKRYYGDVWVGLGRAARAEGRGFVDAFLKTEPNRLGEEFRQALFQQTEGHPLFTIELVRNLQEGGGLLQDEEGRWVEGPALDWGMLPARVEGVIEERIGRLEAELQDILAVASVEGEDFTAQVVARVQEVRERRLLRTLSRELEKRHRLVRERGEAKVGRQLLSRYQFAHTLFQRFLYDDLSAGERRLLHGEIAAVLEELYGGQTQEIAVGLAHHYSEARHVEKAVEYLLHAGDQACLAYANEEAIDYYRRALAFLKEQGDDDRLEPARRDEASSEELIHLYTRLGRALELNSQFDQALANYEEMERLAQQRGDRPMELASLMAQATLHTVPTPIGDASRGRALLEQVLTLAQELGDQAAEARILWNLMFVSNSRSQAIAYGERSLVLARELNLREQMAYTLNDLGAHQYRLIGRFDQAKEVLGEARSLWRELGDLPMLADNLAVSCTICIHVGEYDQAIAFSEEALQIGQSSNNLWGQSHSLYDIGNVYWERGQVDRAMAVMENCLRLSEVAGFMVAQAGTRTDLAAVYGDLGAIECGLETARLALTVAETHVRARRVYVLGILAHLYLLQGDLAEVEVVVDQAKKDLDREATLNIFFIPLTLADSELALKQNDYERAVAVTDTLLADLRQTGMRAYLPDALYLQGQALLALGQDKAARDRLLEARAEAEAMEARRPLWPVLFALSQLEADPTEARRLRQQARENVEYIAAHTPTAELRTSFLNLPHVRAVLDE